MARSSFRKMPLTPTWGVSTKGQIRLTGVGVRAPVPVEPGAVGVVVVGAVGRAAVAADVVGAVDGVEATGVGNPWVGMSVELTASVAWPGRARTDPPDPPDDEPVTGVDDSLLEPVLLEPALLEPVLLEPVLLEPVTPVPGGRGRADRGGLHRRRDREHRRQQMELADPLVLDAAVGPDVAGHLDHQRVDTPARNDQAIRRTDRHGRHETDAGPRRHADLGRGGGGRGGRGGGRRAEDLPVLPDHGVRSARRGDLGLDRSHRRQRLAALEDVAEVVDGT